VKHGTALLPHWFHHCTKPATHSGISRANGTELGRANGHTLLHLRKEQFINLD
jgi:hypothetical protein